MQRCQWAFKSGWASSNVVGIICPLIVIGLTELPNSRWAEAHPAHPLATSLLCPPKQKNTTGTSGFSDFPMALV